MQRDQIAAGDEFGEIHDLHAVDRLGFDTRIHAQDLGSETTNGRRHSPPDTTHADDADGHRRQRPGSEGSRTIPVACFGGGVVLREPANQGQDHRHGVLGHHTVVGPGVVVTNTPRALAADMSIESTPTPMRAMTFRSGSAARVGASNGSVLTIAACAPAMIRCTSAGVRSPCLGSSTTVQPRCTNGSSAESGPDRACGQVTTTVVTR